uniref:NADH-ubiquinone oxidoreductase chain 5 n=1 Tax=Urechis unicinctus TaxID=6432 RepID=C5G6F7_UREUN|nr:NADH dehydrogenase subunit 5 [Urechis unicinctus]ABR12814.2 NADH dehydrogenase subunit 5 [Urechis unicinctus]
MTQPFSRSAFSLIFMAIPTLILSSSLMMNNYSILIEWQISDINSTPLLFTMVLDPVGTLTSAAVMFIAGNVLLFAKTYMQEETFKSRFNTLVLLFVLSMNMLIYLPHLIMLLLGWDGLGIISFLLVIYYQSPKALGAGMITALTNRIGDAMLLVAIALTLSQAHWNIFNFTQEFLNSPYVALSIMIAAMTKSAQVPFSSWLPAAMAAPTPVSALVHSSTLVTAGVFLLIRFYPFLSSFYWFAPALLFTSTLTMLMAGLSAILECDLKKIIALSTLSQLGVMMAALGLNQPKFALFHLITHALFKALLFVCAGTLIHYHHHTQDLRTMGNLPSQLPITMSTMFLANLALCGFPFLAGFYSKDLILEAALFFNHNLLMIILIFLATMLTAVYSMRMTMASLVSPSYSSPLISLENETKSLTTPALNLCMAAIVGGSVLNWMLMTPLTPFILSSQYKMLTPIVVTLGLLIAYLIGMNPSFNKNITLTPSEEATFNMWYLAPLSSQFIMSKPMELGSLVLTQMDQGWLESPAQGASQALSLSGSNAMTLQNNIMNKYLFMSFVIFTTLIIMA